MTSTLRKNPRALAALLFACSVSAPAAHALEPIDEGEVSVGAGTLAIAPPTCAPRRDRHFPSPTEVSAGKLTPDSIQQTFEANVAAIVATYQRVLTRHCVAGSIRLAIDTGPTGNVTRVDMKFSNPGLAVIRHELARTVAGFRFELTGVPASFGYTLNLYPQ
ncbi:MAG: hypothetical protein K0R03_1577 [Moraxellaceae bacterium]|jgi:hypothetical protein|nr:hypothetical protein [Moraxellaceae bacterium]